jgi:F-type H+-transporting ATPase subunit b
LVKPILRVPLHASSLAVMLALAVVLAALAPGARPVLAAQPVPVQPASALEPQTAEHAPAGEQAHATGESLWSLIARLLNFAVLAGTLVYFLKKPFASYLRNRDAQIRRELLEAEELRGQAAAQIAAIEDKLRALPAELEGLRTRGAEELAAEEARLRAHAEAERDRLLEHARREIDLHVRAAKQELAHEAAALAVGVAADRIKSELTPEAHLRLVDRYAAQVEGVGGLRD